MSDTMGKQDRFDALLRIVEQQTYVDVMNREAVDQYIEITGAAYRMMNYGAHKCPMMGRDLSEMAADGLLERHRVGITLGYSGMPKWVWSYALADLGRDRLHDAAAAIGESGHE